MLEKTKGCCARRSKALRCMKNESHNPERSVTVRRPGLARRATIKKELPLGFRPSSHNRYGINESKTTILVHSFPHPTSSSSVTTIMQRRTGKAVAHINIPPLVCILRAFLLTHLLTYALHRIRSLVYPGDDMMLLGLGAHGVSTICQTFARFTHSPC